MRLAPECLAAIALLAATSIVPRARSAPRQFTIEATDYAYKLPATVPPGPSVFRFVNHGHMLHEVQFFRFNPNISAAAARKYLASGNVPDSVADANGGVLIAPPGGTTREALYVELQPGERYALMCQFRDKPGSPQHTQLGMVALLEVK